MPYSADTITRDSHLQVLLMGFSKIGKTYSTIRSMVKSFGRGYVFSSGPRSGMARIVEHGVKDFTYDLIRDEVDYDSAIKEARRGVKEKEYHWVFVDDFSLYASMLHDILKTQSAGNNTSGKADGRQFYGELRPRILNSARRVLDIKTHVVFASHWIESTKEIEGQRAKSGQGILPLIPGAAREELPALFSDVLFMEIIDGKRVFQVNPGGVWGPGSKAVEGTHTIDADFAEFMKLAKLPIKKK
jgi:AAA domain